MVDKKQAPKGETDSAAPETVTATAAAPVSTALAADQDTPETRPYRLRDGFIHHVAHKEVKAGETVQLTANQYLAFSDRFQPLTSTGEGQMPTSAAAPSGNYQDPLAGNVSDVVKYIEGDTLKTPAQLRELAASEQLGKNRGEVLDTVVKRLAELEQK